MSFQVVLDNREIELIYVEYTWKCIFDIFYTTIVVL